MYFLTACLIVVVVSAAISLRRSRNLSQPQWATPAQRLAARRRALWPTICAGFCLLVLLGFHHFQHEQELGLTATTYLMMLVASFFGGSFLGVIGGMD
jgi:tryptophan-rich sensory protein